MKYCTGNILEQIGKVSAICITTNGFTKNNGDAVMGMGIAKQMAEKFPELPTLLGRAIRANGNCVNYLTTLQGHTGRSTRIYSFPVKPISLLMPNQDAINRLVVSHGKKHARIGAYVPGFHCKANVEIIRRSALELLEVHKRDNLSSVILPLPGCGAGELSFKKNVETMLMPILGSHYYLMSYKPEDFRK